MKKILFGFSVLALALLLNLTRSSTVSAQLLATGSSTPNPTGITTVISDYAKDVQDGERETANDKDAQNNQKDVADNENVEGKEETETVEPQEAIESEGGTSSEGSGQKSGEQQKGDKE